MSTLAQRRRQWRRRHHIGITIAVVLATAAHYACEALAPGLSGLSPIIGLGANLIWIWSE
jgi:hypothetical protein